MATLLPGKHLLHKTLFGLAWELRRIRSANDSAAEGFAYGDEDAIIRDLLAEIQVRHQFVVDIGAGDGEYMSNSYSRFKSGWQGSAVEWNGRQFAKLAYRYAGFSDARLLRARVTPDNVLDLLAACETPTEFGFLSLEYRQLRSFRSRKASDQVSPITNLRGNQRKAPPLRFTVKSESEGTWGKDHFYGQSISMLEDLGNRQGYDLVTLEYNNAFLIRCELNPIPSKTSADAWRQGYVNRRDRLQRCGISHHDECRRCKGLPPRKV